MKKILILLLITININYVYAEDKKEIDHVEYKWYQEERIDTKYYPKKYNLPGYYEDVNNIEYSDPTQWGISYCNYDQNYYLIESKTSPKYKKPISTRYISLNTPFGTEGVENYKEIKVFYDNQELNYKVLINNKNVTKLELDKQYDTIHLHFYIDTELRYFIYLFNDFDLTKWAISYSVIPYYHGKTLYPTEEWISQNTIFIWEGTTGNIPDSPLIKDIEMETICRLRDIKTLRYKINKKYYDDNYHTFIDDYIPDINERIIYYKEEKTSNNEPEVKIETKIETKTETKFKTIKEKIYSYLKPDKETITKTVYKDKYKNKYIYKKIIPKTVYIIIILLIIIILTCLIKILFKNDD